jgi:glycosyltransferase involved in cell wall biosynthesis
MPCRDPTEPPAEGQGGRPVTKHHLVTPYGRNGGSSRVRVHEWVARTSADCHVSQYVGHSNASPRYLLNHPSKVLTAERALRAVAASQPDTLLLHREASPLSRGMLEIALLRSGTFSVFELDDALYEDHGEGGLWRRLAPKSVKAAACARQADRVIAGNARLAEWASMHNDDVVVIPSCVAPERYRTRPMDRGVDVPRLIWIGSRDNEAHLQLIEPALAEIHRRTGARLTLIGTTVRSLGRLEAIIDRIAWTETVQHQALSNAEVGVMPLPDDPYSRGKCAYKLLQYAAAGIPFVGHPVGANADVLERFRMPGPRTNGEWIDAILHLLASAGRIDAMGRRARALVELDWSYTAWLPKWEEAVGVVPDRAHPREVG